MPDGRWTTAANWSGDVLPAISDAVYVGAAANVSHANGDFSSLEIAPGASVTLGTAAAELSSKTVTIEGTLDFVGIFRPRTCSLDLSGGALGAGITWWT